MRDGLDQSRGEALNRGSSPPLTPTEAPNAFSPALPDTSSHKVPSLVLSLSKDKMQALLSVKPGPDPKEKLVWEDILLVGERMGLPGKCFQPEVVMGLCDAWNQKKEMVADVVVAESFQPPQPGVDGKLEWLIRVPWGQADAQAEAKAPPIESAMRDMREVRAIVAVEAGQPILRVVPPGKGISGQDLLGGMLQALDGKPYPFQPGVNIDEIPGQPGVWKANKSGFLRLKDGRPEVQECFTVEGDVDYTTGNIKYERSAEIRGDIQDGFGVCVGGELAIGGTVGDCRVVVGSNVLIRGGFQGKGQGHILAKGAVTLGFCSNQSIRAYGPIEILKEAYNMQIFTRHSLRVHGNLVGGRALAQNGLECSVAGNDHGTPTLIEIGMDYVAWEGLQEVESRLKDYTEAQSRFQARMNQLKESYRLTQRMVPELAREMMTIRQALEKLDQALPILNSRRTLLAESLRKGFQRMGLTVRIEKKAFAGVTVKMGAEQIRLNENLPGPRRFVFTDGRIKVY
jgi:uncharacterized protein (DUF342 family)